MGVISFIPRPQELDVLLYLHLSDMEPRLREVRQLSQSHPGFQAQSTKIHTAPEVGVPLLILWKEMGFAPGENFSLDVLQSMFLNIFIKAQ